MVLVRYPPPGSLLLLHVNSSLASSERWSPVASTSCEGHATWQIAVIVGLPLYFMRRPLVKENLQRSIMLSWGALPHIG